MEEQKKTDELSEFAQGFFLASAVWVVLLSIAIAGTVTTLNCIWANHSILQNAQLSNKVIAGEAEAASYRSQYRELLDRLKPKTAEKP